MSELVNKAPALQTWFGLILHLTENKKLPMTEVKKIIDKYEKPEDIAQAYKDHGLIK